jgi:hypothetical protein
VWGVIGWGWVQRRIVTRVGHRSLFAPNDLTLKQLAHKPTAQPEDAAKVRKYRFEKDRRLALGSQLLQRAVIAWTFGVPYRDILIARTGALALCICSDWIEVELGAFGA